MEQLNIILILIFIVLQVLDVKTTLKVLSQGGREVWLSTKWVLDKFGNKKGLYGIKIVICIIWALVMGLNRHYQEIVILQIIFIVVYSFVAWRNYKQIK